MRLGIALLVTGAMLGVLATAQRPARGMIQLSIGWLSESLTIDDLDQLFAEINAVFRDSGCDFTVSVEGSPPTVFSLLDGRVDLAQKQVKGRLDSVTSDDARLARIPVNVKVVQQIKRCGRDTSKEEIGGCTGQRSGWITIIKDINPDLRGIVWAHELGHSLGLVDVDIAGNLMQKTARAGNTQLTSAQCMTMQGNIPVVAQYRARTRGRVLAVTASGSGSSHVTKAGDLIVIAELGRDSGLWSTVFSDTTAPLTLQAQPNIRTLQSADAVVFRTSGSPTMSPRQQQDLLDFVQNPAPGAPVGRGFLGIHSAIDSYGQWKAYGDMLGGRYTSDLPPNFSATVIVDDQQFPATRNLGAQFLLQDGIARIGSFSGTNARVLAHVNLQGTTAQQYVPIAWAKLHGSGRVFYSNIGHNNAVLRQPEIRTMYLEAVKWILGYTDASDLSPLPLIP